MFQDYKFFGHRLTPEGLKVDLDKVSEIKQMKPPETRYDPTLSELAEPLRRLWKCDMMWTWDSQQQTTFEKKQVYYQQSTSISLL